MKLDFYLTDSDMQHLEDRFKYTSNEDFLEFITALANERRLRMRADLMITNPASPLIKKLADVVSPTLGAIKHFACNRGWRKSSEFISEINSKKAKRKAEANLLQKAEAVTNPTKWFRSIKEGQVLNGKFESASKCKSVSSMLARWNHTEGIDSGIFISARYYWEIQVITIKALRRTDDD